MVTIRKAVIFVGDEENRHAGVWVRKTDHGLQVWTNRPDFPGPFPPAMFYPWGQVRSVAYREDEVITA